MIRDKILYEASEMFDLELLKSRYTKEVKTRLRPHLTALVSRYSWLGRREIAEILGITRSQLEQLIYPKNENE